MDASQTMLERVKHARSEAERSYDLAADLIQMKSQSSIDLFSDDAGSRVVEIASDTRNAIEDLYSAYQTLIQLLDAELRPLLAESPSTSAVKEVYECIRHFNAESQISSNFNGSFNGSSLGSLASIKLSPTMECRMIERFWEQAHHGIRGIGTPHGRTARGRRLSLLRRDLPEGSLHDHLLVMRSSKGLLRTHVSR